MKYRKKAIVIEATQWFKDGDHPAVVLTAPAMGAPRTVPAIYTLEGWHYVTPGDWIITGIKGEVYPCKPDIFAATYDAVNAEGAADEQGRRNAQANRAAGYVADPEHPLLSDFLKGAGHTKGRER